MPQSQEALIIEHDGTWLDEDGDLLLGWYWVALDPQGEQLGSPMGPYTNNKEAEAACRRAFARGEF